MSKEKQTFVRKKCLSFIAKQNYYRVNIIDRHAV